MIIDDQGHVLQLQLVSSFKPLLFDSLRTTRHPWDLLIKIIFIIMSSGSGKPLPLKQRTCSVDPRRDYTTQTWISVLALVKIREYLITVDHFCIWRRHLAWAVENGKDLRDYMTQRYASSMVFMSLLLSIELNVLLNAAGVTTAMRQALLNEEHLTVSFWAGIAIILSAVLTLLSLISTFTAWTMVSAVSEANAHCIFRSSIGQYVAELPGRFIVGSIYSFLVWICLFFFLLLPAGFWSGLLLSLVVCLFVHTITAFSAFGRIIMHTGAMGSTRIFDKTYESSLSPHCLHSSLLIKAKANLGNKTSIMRQYQSKSKPLTRIYSESEMSGLLSDRSSSNSRSPFSATPDITPARTRTESLVKFADGFDTNGERFDAGTRPQITPRNQEIIIQRDAKTSISAPTPDSAHSANVTTTKLRPPRPLLATRKQSESFNDDITPMIKNQVVTPFVISPSGFVDRWISSSSRSPSEYFSDLDDQLPDSFLATDFEGNTTRVSIDNPYLLHEDPTPFPPVRSPPPTYGSNSRSSSASSEDNKLNYCLTHDEFFDRQYGDIFAKDYFSGNDEKSASKLSAEHEPLLGTQDGFSTLERIRLVDNNQLERGDYHSKDRTGKS